MSNKTQLPVEVVEEIKISSKKEAAAFIKKTPKKVISRVGLQNICAASYGAGATAYATKLHELGASFENLASKHYEAKNLLNEVLVMNEMWGDLPGEFINEVKTFLYGE